VSGDINKDEIRKAIDRLQAEHPVQFPFDVTKLDNDTDFTGIQRAIDVLARKCQDDAEINIICEMAKLYLDGVKPTVERPHGEWREDSDDYDVRCSCCGITCDALNKSNHERLNVLTGGKWWTFYRFCPRCGALMRKEGEAK